MPDDAALFESWAVLELMGHRQRVGLVREVELFGGKLLRIDIPLNAEATEEKTVTEYYGVTSVYALRPCTEDVARNLARNADDPRPIRPASFRSIDQLSFEGNRGDDHDRNDD